MTTWLGETPSSTTGCLTSTSPLLVTSLELGAPVTLLGLSMPKLCLINLSTRVKSRPVSYYLFFKDVLPFMKKHGFLNLSNRAKSRSASYYFFSLDMCSANFLKFCHCRKHGFLNSDVHDLQLALKRSIKEGILSNLTFNLS